MANRGKQAEGIVLVRQGGVDCVVGTQRAFMEALQAYWESNTTGRLTLLVS